MKSTLSLIPLLFTGGAILALAACGGGGRGTVQQADLDAAGARVTELESTLAALRSSLAEAQGALRPGSTTEQREQAQKALEKARTDIQMVEEELAAQPASPAKAATAEALTAIDEALDAVNGALAATEALSGGSIGPLVLASMHTALDRAQMAIDSAQDKLNDALKATPESATALRNLLAQAQATLTTTQVSLVPVLREELADARDRADAAEDALAAEEKRAEDALAAEQKRAADALAAEQKRAADALAAEQKKAADAREQAAAALAAEQQRANNEQQRADRFDPRVTLGNSLEPRDPGGQLVGAGETNAEITYMARTAYTGKDALDDDAKTVAANFAYDTSFIPTAAVPYEAGKGLFGAGRTSDELPLRGLVLRSDTRNAAAAGTNSNDDKLLPFQGREVIGDIDTDFDLTDSTWKNFEQTFLSSIQLPADGSGGPTMKMGGQGVIFYDLEQRRRAAGGFCPTGTTTHCDDATTDDVKVGFNRQAVQDPSGYPAWFWHTDVPFDPAGRNSEIFDPAGYVLGGAVTDANNADFTDGTPADSTTYTGHSDIDREGLLDIDGDGEADYRVFDTSYSATPNYVLRNLYTTPRQVCGQTWCNPDDPRDGGGPLSQGEYQLLLSNYAGDGDSEHRYLDYAAYGLFVFLDHILAGTYETAGYRRPGRLQAFHFGYDAFADADGMKTTDLTTPISATFEGSTTGWLFPGKNLRAVQDHIRAPIRMRGEVELTAMIGGTGAGSNEISGWMRNFEFLNDGRWRSNPSHLTGGVLPNAARIIDSNGDLRTQYNAEELGNAVRLVKGDIGADGSYKGVAEAIVTGGSYLPVGEGGSGRPGGSGTHFFQNGEYEGNFYGPHNALETAGAWYLQEHLNLATGTRGGKGSIVGSFGAKRTGD